MIRRVAVVFLKETLDNLRDRRSLSLAFVYPLLGPALVAVLMGLMSNVLVAEPGRERLVAAVDGRGEAPELMSLLESRGVRLLPPPADPVGAVMRGVYSTVLLVPKGFETDLAAGRQVELRLIADSSKLAGLVASARIGGMLGEYAHRLA
ncbi:MAG: hypothetical protein HQL34_14120, partial [Alphaproteobacteria bacterium]|nr:hypothetical protein [Alphaproteobacteria bacterium]